MLMHQLGKLVNCTPFA